MKRLTIIFIGVWLLFVHSTDVSAKIDQAHADKVAGTLKTASTADDSLKILYDVYDLSDRENREAVGKQILSMAARVENKEMIVDMLNQMASTLDDADSLGMLLQISSTLPENENKKSVELMLQMEQAKSEAEALVDSNREKELIKYSRINAGSASDLYEEILDLYRAMVYLGVTSQGPMYLSYITRLEELVNQLPPDEYAIRNLFYTTAAIYYTHRQDYKKAIECDRQLLRQIEGLEKQYKKTGRQYSNFGYFYYVAYRRMLANYKGLTNEEIEDLFAKCMDLAANNQDVRESFGSGGLAKSYYYTATKKYDLAIPEIRKALEHPNISKFRRQLLLGMLAEAYQATGNKDGELTALREFSKILREERHERQNDAYKELEIRNTIQKLNRQDAAQQEQTRMENRRMRKISITLVYVLAAILIFICQAYFKLKHKVHILESRNDKLRNNIEQMFDDGMPKGTKDVRRKQDRLKG